MLPTPPPTVRRAPIVLQTRKLSFMEQLSPVPLASLEMAEKQLAAGDRGGAYLTMYEEMANEQLLVQAQITTFTGVWGSGAMTGNGLAKEAAGPRYNLCLEQFSHDIAAATLAGVRRELEAGRTGRLSDSDLQQIDRDVWASKGMAELFPGNVQFLDFWNHQPGERLDAIFSAGTWNVVGAAARALTPNTAPFNRDGRNVSNLVGKRPAEFAGRPEFELHGDGSSRFLTVTHRDTGKVEAFWDKQPRSGSLRMPQIKNAPMAPDSPERRQRDHLCSFLGVSPFPT